MIVVHNFITLLGLTSFFSFQGTENLSHGIDTVRINPWTLSCAAGGAVGRDLEYLRVNGPSTICIEMEIPFLKTRGRIQIFPEIDRKLLAVGCYA